MYIWAVITTMKYQILPRIQFHFRPAYRGPEISTELNTKKMKACFPLGEFVRANRVKSDLIGWRQTLTTSSTNHIHFLLVPSGKRA